MPDAGSVHSTPPWPAYEPKVLYNYRSSNGLGLNDNELAEMCFPNKVMRCGWFKGHTMHVSWIISAFVVPSVAFLCHNHVTRDPCYLILKGFAEEVEAEPELERAQRGHL